ncbi:hypothetical protein AN265_04925 [Staphylococcus aureus]|nr:hypothetical protein [Staphylococcus aureus]
MLVRGPNKEADEKSAYNNVQVGEGPQHREFRKEILQAMQVGGWAPTKRNWISNFYRQCKSARPQHKSCDYDKVLLHN